LESNPFVSYPACSLLTTPAELSWLFRLQEKYNLLMLLIEFPSLQAHIIKDEGMECAAYMGKAEMHKKFLSQNLKRT
jgi:hypothetical protein